MTPNVLWKTKEALGFFRMTTYLFVNRNECVTDRAINFSQMIRHTKGTST